MPKIHLRQPGFMDSACGSFTKKKKKKKKIKVFIKVNKTKPAFNMIWLEEMLKICLEEELLVNNYLTKHLILLKLQNMININMNFLQWLTILFIKTLLVVLLKAKLFGTSN